MKSEPTSEMQFFMLVARLGSLTAAARAVDLTPPAATKRLAALEQRLGARLLNRTTRCVSLTGEGETYLRYATRILAEIAEMEEAVTQSRATPRGLLRVLPKPAQPDRACARLHRFPGRAFPGAAQ